MKMNMQDGKWILIDELDFQIGERVWCWVPEYCVLVPVIITGLEASIYPMNADEDNPNLKCYIDHILEWDDDRDHLASSEAQKLSSGCLDRDSDNGDPNKQRTWKAEFLFRNAKEFADWIADKAPDTFKL